MGARGRTGAVGARGVREGLPLRHSITEVGEQIDGIYEELAVQLTRMGQIQVQVDELRSKIRNLLGAGN